MTSLEQLIRGEVVPGHCIRLTEEPARVGVPQNGHASDPQVEVIREGDIIRAIDITCSCGQRIRLRCDY